MKNMLFRPFRLALWARLAVVALLTGEVGGTGGGGGIRNTDIPNFPKSGGDDQWRMATHFYSVGGWTELRENLIWIVPLVLTALALVLLFIYCACVYRFILLDAVLTGECNLRAGWRKWRDVGREYFLWVLAVGLTGVIALGVVIGIPVLLAYRAGWFEKAQAHIGGLIGWGLLVGLLAAVIALFFAVADLLGRDFLIPVMALENVDAVEGWRRLLPMMGADKLAYVAYVLMKAVLAVGSAIAFTIVNIIVILILLIPMGIVGLVGFLVGKSLGVNWDNISVILILVALGLLALAAILYAVGFVYSPGLVFFQAYALEFFASRYEKLKERMAPATAAPTAAPIPPWPQMPPMVPPNLPGDAFPV